MRGLVLILSIVNVVCSMRPVTLRSSLRENQISLCPGETVVSFLCTTACTRVYWKVRDPAVGTRVIAFRSGVDELGSSERAHDSYATFLQCSAEDGCVSVLNIAGTARGMMVVQCYNGTYSTMEEIEFYRGVPDPPSEPVITDIRRNGAPKSFDITWGPGPISSISQLSHYIVQLDNAPSVWVQASTTTVTLFSDAPSETNHTVYLQAVDMCGQESGAATESRLILANEDVTSIMPTSASVTGKGHLLGSNSILMALPLFMASKLG